MSQATVKCDECESIVELTRGNDRSLILMCDCPEQRSLKVARALPAGWRQ